MKKSIAQQGAMQGRRKGILIEFPLRPRRLCKCGKKHFPDDAD